MRGAQDSENGFIVALKNSKWFLMVELQPHPRRTVSPEPSAAKTKTDVVTWLSFEKHGCAAGGKRWPLSNGHARETRRVTWRTSERQITLCNDEDLYTFEFPVARSFVAHYNGDLPFFKGGSDGER